ncbi:PREDICTED: cytochrome c oxidase assembly factor 5 [Dufourea novaeangliae]|uniref:Cytochrome c oxidase assembly factor 5 n=1 Tax=Dufourea novaeangliae TaxID=178035 RepID=A0A154P343_DUFNO|nr:PREDICTED: cytochrome c oxidase assembly factor 5 [Dufourea novaeangliae]KZC06291.1 Cytochrome c oxidase assembly factor 5 [Dufourea novaeangliae]
MMRYSEEGETLKDNTKCATIRANLKMCLLQSDCCKIYKRTPRECLRSKDKNVPDECYALHKTFFDCKHSIIDGRRRFRGPKGGY